MSWIRGPVRVLLGGGAAPAVLFVAFVASRKLPKIGATNRFQPLDLLWIHVPPEPAGKGQQVDEAHSVVSVEIQVIQEVRVALPAAERAEESSQVEQVHVAVAVAVAEQPEEVVHTVSSRQTIAISVQFPSYAIVDLVGPDRQAITAVRQRAADDVRSREAEDGDRPAVHDGHGDLQTDQAGVLPA